MRCRARVRCDGALPLPPATALARVATARSSKRQAHAGPASGGYRPRASLQSTRSNERTNPSNREGTGRRTRERRLRCRARVPTSGAKRRRETTHTRNPGTQQPGRRHAPVECRLHNDRELSCKDEGRLGGSLRPESRPPALSASNDMLSGQSRPRRSRQSSRGQGPIMSSSHVPSATHRKSSDEIEKTPDASSLPPPASRPPRGPSTVKDTLKS